MRVLIDGLNLFYGEKLRLVKTLMKRESPEEYPELMKWALQMLYFDGNEWVEICRIDNYRHENREGSHVHTYKKEEVEWVGVSFQEAEELIKKISERILKEKFMVLVKFDEE